MSITCQNTDTPSSESLFRMNDKFDKMYETITIASKRSEALENILPNFQRHVALRGTTKKQRGDMASMLIELHSQAQSSLMSRRILKTLVFDEVHSREDAIPVAHAETFSWVFEEEQTTFVEWASSGNGRFLPLLQARTQICRVTDTVYEGMFWVTGKPGSGKSTLMKYLVQQPRTHSCLEKWAGSDEVVTAFHCFWNAGTAIQKSQSGLLRTLLIRIIQQCPNLAQRCVPKRFQNTDDLHNIAPWRHGELIETIRSFGASLKGDVRICFFIDGLDEYEGESTDLIELISSLCESPCVKACVSSRPWNAFTRAYHNRVGGELEVQKLTERDIKAYIADNMNADRTFQRLRKSHSTGCDRLMGDISSKAQGVFLWVYLVVRSLLRGLGNDDDLKILQRRLDSYPDTLDRYFDRMLNRIEDVYRVESSRLLLLAMSAEKALPFWAPRCVELETEDNDYAEAIETPPSARDASLVYGCDCAYSRAEFSLAMDASRAGPTFKLHADEDSVNHHCYYLFGEDNEWTRQQKASLRRYLDSRCADLLEVVSGGIVFVHRTARDFLVQSDLSLTLYKSAGVGYDVGRTLSSLEMVRWKRDQRFKVFTSGCDFSVSIGDVDAYQSGCMPNAAHGPLLAWTTDDESDLEVRSQRCSNLFSESRPGGSPRSLQGKRDAFIPEQILEGLK